MSPGISDELTTAWQTLPGRKGKYWIAILWAAFIQFPMLIAIQLVLGTPGVTTIIEMLVHSLYSTFQMVLMLGTLMTAVDANRGIAITPARIFSGFDSFIPLTIAYALISFLTGIGMFFLLLPGIYLAISYLFALPLVLDKKLSPWEAMETSRKRVTSEWFSYFILFILMLFIIFLSAIPFGLGLIWTIPMAQNLYGQIYVKSFQGVKGTS